MPLWVTLIGITSPILVTLQGNMGKFLPIRNRGFDALYQKGFVLNIPFVHISIRGQIQELNIDQLNFYLHKLDA